VLTKTEELDLAIKAKSNSDRGAFEKLINSNLRFVFQVAHIYKNRGLDFEDLVSEGNLGLLKAFEKFDPTRDIRFISYAV
jgi:RNA polymerase primary sigma factor